MSSERGGRTTVVSDEDIAQALESLFREPNPNPNPTFTVILQQLQSKLGCELSHKVDFIRAQIQHIFTRHQPQNDHFALHSQPPYFGFGSYHLTRDYSFRPPLQPHHMPQAVSKPEPFPTAVAASAPPASEAPIERVTG